MTDAAVEGDSAAAAEDRNGVSTTATAADVTTTTKAVNDVDTDTTTSTPTPTPTATATTAAATETPTATTPVASAASNGGENSNSNDTAADAAQSTQTTPRRNPSTESLRSAGPLPSIEECLFGGKDQNQQVIAVDGTLLVNNNNDNDNNDNSDNNKDNTTLREEDYFVPLNVLRRVASQGIEDDDEQNGSLRALAWRVLLGYLPADRREWKTVAAQQRQTYGNFVQELFTIDERDMDGSELRGHHAKRQRRKSSKVKRTKSDRERRRKQREKLKQQQQQQEESPRAPIKFMDEDDEDDLEDNDDDATEKVGMASSERSNSLSNGLERAPSEDSCSTTLPPDPAVEQEKAASQNTLEKIMREPSKWNLTDREQKILERLTQHQAINQLLVKRDCKDWNNFLENAKLLDEIRKDVNRTHPHLYFYLEPNHQLGARRYAALERILFVWAKLNKGVRYVQGMNELVGTLYYVLANDFNGEWADHAEADTYILFNIIMSEIRDIFVADLDSADTGIVGRIENMHNLLGLHDPQVKGHLDAMGIDASFYAVRWLTTLLSREFLLPDTIRLWDSMFASTHKENFMRYVCVSMVLKIRDDLLMGDFATCLQLLQKYPSCSMDDLLDASRALWIYESQITMARVKGGVTLHQALQAIPPPEKIIMAFGLKGGVALSNREQLAEAGANAKVAVKNNVQKAKQSMQTLSSAGQGFLGGARRFIKGRIQRNLSEGAPSPAGGDNDEEADIPKPRRRLPFRNVSWGGRDASSPNGDADSEIGEKAAATTSPTPVTPTSDVETL